MRANRPTVLAIGSYLVATITFLVVSAAPGSTVGVPAPPGGRADLGLLGASRLVHLTTAIGPRTAIGSGAMVLVVVAFAALAWACWRGRVSSRAVLTLIVAVNALVVLGPVLFSRDVYSYAAYGRIAAIYHRNPYVIAPGAFPADPLLRVIGPVWRDEPSVYGPAFTWLSGAIAGAGRSAFLEVTLFRTTMAAAVVGTCLALAGITRRVAPARTAFALAVTGLSPVVPFMAVAGGHNDPLVALGSVVGLWLMLAGRPRAAILAWTLGALVKLTGGIALLVGAAGGIWSRPAGHRARAVAGSAVTCIVTVVVVAAPFEQTDEPFLGQLRLVNRDGWISPTRALGRLLSVITGGDAGGAVVTAVRDLALLCAVLAVVTVALAVARSAGRSGLDPAEVVAGVGVATILCTLLLPVGLPWYVMWALPFVWVVRPTLRVATLVVATVQFLSLPVADADLFPRAFHTTARIADGVLGPAMIVILVVVLRDVLRTWRDGFADPDLLGEARMEPAEA